MKVIIVEVTRAANSFGQTHLGQDPRGLRPDRRRRRRGAGARRVQAPTVTPQFAALAFYGAIEQVLTGWIFDSLPQGEAEFERGQGASSSRRSAAAWTAAAQAVAGRVGAR